MRGRYALRKYAWTLRPPKSTGQHGNGRVILHNLVGSPSLSLPQVNQHVGLSHGSSRAWVLCGLYPAEFLTFCSTHGTSQREMPVFGLTHDHTVSGIIVSGSSGFHRLAFNQYRMRFPLNACKSRWIATRLLTTELSNGPCVFPIPRHEMHPQLRQSVTPRKLVHS